jgi:hypothetical protein
MSGILNKKDSLIDYKLTENGRKQIQNNDINYVYYSFSDSSIVYHGNQSDVYDENISESEFHYIPFEVSTDPKNYVNPEFNLTQNLDLNYIDNDITRTDDSTKFLDLNTKFTLANQIKSKNLLNNLDVLVENKEFTFSRKEKLNKFNFKPTDDLNFLINYPTIDKLSKSTNEIPNINEDNRFSHKLNNKVLNPINKNGSNVLFEEDLVLERNNEGISYVFNAMKGFNIVNTNRNEVIQEVYSKIKKYKQSDMFYLKYEINNKNKNMKIIPELHYIKTNDSNKEKIKLAFLKLDSFKSKENNKEVDVYLIGRVVLKRKLNEDIDVESNLKKIDLSLNYSFINLFTLIAE